MAPKRKATLRERSIAKKKATSKELTTKSSSNTTSSTNAPSSKQIPNKSRTVAPSSSSSSSSSSTSKPAASTSTSKLKSSSTSRSKASTSLTQQDNKTKGRQTVISIVSSSSEEAEPGQSESASDESEVEIIDERPRSRNTSSSSKKVKAKQSTVSQSTTARSNKKSTTKVALARRARARIQDSSKSSSKATKISNKSNKARDIIAYSDELSPGSPNDDLTSHNEAIKIKEEPSNKKFKFDKLVVDWDKQCSDWFDQYADVEDKDQMLGEGIELLFNNMGVSMDSVLPFLLAWELNAPPSTFGSFNRDDFVNHFSQARIASDEDLKECLRDSEVLFYDDIDDAGFCFSHETERRFESFYNFLFGFLKEEGQKSLKGEVAIAAWSIVLSPKYTTAKQFVEYAESLGTGFKGVSVDLWQQLPEFCKTMGDNLENYSDMDAWPSSIDSFVEWHRQHQTKS
ncbi:hypothetical protein OIO90_000103 [Microbotryomycetes sp. JL221]|nr:hypothetical protein OIO90_000103 [Microbotryomycetes sp. JL221]